MKGSLMRTLLHMIRMNFKMFSIYRWSFSMTLLMAPVRMLVELAVYSTIFATANARTIVGYSLNQIVWYGVAVGFCFQFIWNFTDTRISERVLSGELTTDLLRPTTLYRIELAHAVALRMAGVLFEFVPGIILYAIIYSPEFLTVLSLAKYICLMLFSFMLYFSINFFIGTFAFVTKNNSALFTIKMVIFNFAGGVFIPLEFLPHGVNAVLAWLPFKYIFYWPIQFFLNKPETQSLRSFVFVAGVQTGWIVFFTLAGMVAYRWAIRKFCAAGA